VIARRVDHCQLPDLAKVLAAAGLPTSDIAAPGRHFYRFEDENGLVGYGGLEGAGANRLLRSFIVVESRRGTGLATAMLAALERAAADDRVTCLYLLTITAEPFFGRFGYAPSSRTSAPADIADSAEFRSLCPASAAFLFKRIC
jgi:N-acetylglutamate synthase-like GNAT family acetyltransferase